MDRLMVYPGAIPLDTDILSVERNVMEALGWLTQATFGTNTGVVGLACNPTLPASMTVNVGPGALWAQSVIDQNSFGSLPADTSPLMKLGILPEEAGTNFTLTAPTTSGQSINYLIEAAFEESDTNPVVLPYVNPANPSQPYTGPDNSGTPQNTTRVQTIALQLKAGVAANTGTQITPTVDAGYVGLYVITVNFGQTAINAANIVDYANAPFNGGPFAPIAGNAAQTFMGAPAIQTNQFTTLSQFPGVFESTETQFGWTKLPNGLILQWGGAPGSGPVTFPIAFPNQVFAGWVAENFSAPDWYENPDFASFSVAMSTNTTGYINIIFFAGGSQAFAPVPSGYGCKWLALGW